MGKIRLNFITIVLGFFVTEFDLILIILRSIKTSFLNILHANHKNTTNIYFEI